MVHMMDLWHGVGASLEVHVYLEIMRELWLVIADDCSMHVISSALNWLRSWVHLTSLQHFESTALWEGSDGDLEKQLTNMMTPLGHN